MHPTPSPSTLSRRAVWQRLAVAFVGVAVPGLALRPAVTSANQQGTTVSDNANWQLAICQAGGGTGTVTEVGRYVDGIRSISTLCTGGAFGGVNCFSHYTLGITCWKSGAASSQAPITSPLMSYDVGSVQGLDVTTAALTQELQTLAETGSTASQEQGIPARKRRRHRKGKKGGKRR